MFSLKKFFSLILAGMSRQYLKTGLTNQVEIYNVTTMAGYYSFSWCKWLGQNPI